MKEKVKVKKAKSLDQQIENIEIKKIALKKIVSVLNNNNNKTKPFQS